MKKFKVKNRQKRKYVRKSDLIASYASAQSITIGLVPIFLIAIAFFTTFLIANPHILAVQLPTIQVTLPEMPTIAVPKVHVSIPEVTLPHITLPQKQRVTLPKITLPDIQTPIVSFITTFVTTSEHFMKHTIKITTTTCENMTIAFLDAVKSFGYTLARAITQYKIELVQGVQLLGQASKTMIVFLVTTYIKGIINMGIMLRLMIIATVSSVYQFSLFIEDMAVAFAKIAIVWTKAALWFLGTPFRALHAYSIGLGTILAPYMAFLSDAFGQAADDLHKGGANLVNGTVYVSETVEHNQQKK